MMILWLLLALVIAILLVALLDLAVIKRGVKFDKGPDGKPHWVRPNSWVNRLTGHEGLSLFRTTHVRAGAHESLTFAEFLAHEWRHLWQEDGADNPAPIGSWTMLRKYHELKATVEPDAIKFGAAHLTDPYFVAMATRLIPVFGGAA